MRKYEAPLAEGLFLLLMAQALSGCATYKFHHGNAPHDKGYVVSRDDYTILEYTLGKDNSVPPERKLAKERFKRRKNIVENKYKRMGYVENHFKMAAWDPAITFLKMVGGVLRLPFVAISDFRYKHNPEYRERIKRIEAEQDAQEAKRIKKLKEELGAYIQKDLQKESGVPQPAMKTTQATQQIPTTLTKEIQPEQKVSIVEAAGEVKTKEKEKKAAEIAQQLNREKENIARQKEMKEEEDLIREAARQKNVPQKEERQIAVQEEGQLPTAVIIAKPVKGPSPLKVRFDASRSYSSSGAKIISYYWEFGDGDTSTKANPSNTYWSASYGSRYFTASLTVKDARGKTAKTETAIEVANK